MGKNVVQPRKYKDTWMSVKKDGSQIWSFYDGGTKEEDAAGLGLEGFLKERRDKLDKYRRNIYAQNFLNVTKEEEEIANQIENGTYALLIYLQQILQKENVKVNNGITKAISRKKKFKSEIQELLVNYNLMYEQVNSQIEESIKDINKSLLDFRKLRNTFGDYLNAFNRLFLKLTFSNSQFQKNKSGVNQLRKRIIEISSLGGLKNYYGEFMNGIDGKYIEIRYYKNRESKQDVVLNLRDTHKMRYIVASFMKKAIEEGTNFVSNDLDKEKLGVKYIEIEIKNREKLYEFIINYLFSLYSRIEDYLKFNEKYFTEKNKKNWTKLLKQIFTPNEQDIKINKICQSMMEKTKNIANIYTLKGEFFEAFFTDLLNQIYNDTSKKLLEGNRIQQLGAEQLVESSDVQKTRGEANVDIMMNEIGFQLKEGSSFGVSGKNYTSPNIYLGNEEIKLSNKESYRYLEEREWMTLASALQAVPIEDQLIDNMLYKVEVNQLRIGVNKEFMIKSLNMQGDLLFNSVYLITGRFFPASYILFDRYLKLLRKKNPLEFYRIENESDIKIKYRPYSETNRLVEMNSSLARNALSDIVLKRKRKKMR